MFGTIIMDAYKENEKEEIANALDDLCCPTDTYGWASAGIYCFWDYYTKEIYYMGLAVDLTERFKQHNGLMKIDPNACKKKQIDEYFKTKEKLGYSIFVQSTLSQPITHRNKEQYKGFLGEDFSIEDYVGKEGEEHIKQVEGILIEAYRKANGKFPKWNRIGGSIDGQESATIGNYAIVKSFNDFKPNPLVARSTLREISKNPTYERYENFLHAIRMDMLHKGSSFGEALEFYKQMDFINTYDNIEKDRYLYKSVVV